MSVVAAGLFALRYFRAPEQITYEQWNAIKDAIDHEIEAELAAAEAAGTLYFPSRYERGLEHQKAFLQKVKRVQHPTIRRLLREEAQRSLKSYEKRVTARAAHLKEIESETLPECIRALKMNSFHPHFSRRLGDPLRSSGAMLSAQEWIREAMLEPRIARLMAIAEASTQEERRELMAMVRDELRLHGLYQASDMPNCRACNIGSSTASALPLVIGKLDEAGETLPLLVRMAEVFADEGPFLYMESPMLYGNGVASHFADMLAVGIEMALRNLIRSSGNLEELGSESLMDYTHRRAALAPGGSLLGMVMSSAGLKGLLQEPAMMDASGYPMTTREKYKSREPEWFKPGNHNWMVITWGRRILDELRTSGFANKWEIPEVASR